MIRWLRLPLQGFYRGFHGDIQRLGVQGVLNSGPLGLGKRGTAKRIWGQELGASQVWGFKGEGSRI